ncbi:penicillin-binding protein, partial [Candidatus Falkowbacteria bacterium]|nr:penicillin-binding protein [Candidatus Falkowbacteria bacterium]
MPTPYLKTVKHKSKKDWRYKPINSSYQKKPWKKSSSKIKLPKGLFSKLFLLVIFGFIFILGVFAWYGKDLPDPNKLLEREVAQSTTIYDSTGETILYNIHGSERRTLVELEQIPEHLKWATIVVEDRKFYEHSGFNFRRMIITIITDVIQRKSAGASTITQQFVKNAILTPEKKISRKIKELILSYQIEKKFTKDQILKMYFNEIPYGSNAYGAEAASQIYFGKHVEDLDLAESATLAAMPQAPTYYYNHPEDLVARRNYILNQLVKFDYAVEPEAEAAKKKELKFIQKRENIIAPHFVMYVKELLTETYGERTVEKGGLKVTTTLNINKQELAENAVAEYADNNEADYRATNAALVSLDPKNGDIIALVGSRDFYDEEIDGQVNIALSLRQPGSSFKPIVYAAAFKKGYTPSTLLFDVITTFITETGEDYTPHNYDLKEHGPVTIRKALAGSLNIPAVKTIYLTGISNVLDLADSLGYTSLADRSRFGLSLVLGGGEVKLLEHVNAFATFAREGEFLPTRAILKVESSDGEVLEKAEDPAPNKVIDTEIVRQLTSILSDNGSRTFSFGALNYLTLPSRPVAAKTGTTN